MNQRWILKKRPQGALAEGDLELVEEPIPGIGEGEVLLRNLYLSLDPTNRIWMSDREQYLPPVAIGDVMRGVTLAVVEHSRSDRIKEGQIVSPHSGGWEVYSKVRDRHVSVVETMDQVPLTAEMSVLGATGATAYFGMMDIGQPKEGETVVVSAAAGAVGSVAGQLAKVAGAKVVGICGGEKKAKQVVEEYGFDGAIDYRSEDVGDTLDRLCPEGIDVDFENVGGPIMEAVYNRMNDNSRMVLCGMISTYDQAGPVPGPADFSRILMRRMTVRGFVIVDYLSRMREAKEALGQLISDGKLKWRDHVVQGIESAPGAMDLLFTGKNDGKLLVQVSPEP